MPQRYCIKTRVGSKLTMISSQITFSGSFANSRKRMFDYRLSTNYRIKSQPT